MENGYQDIMDKIFHRNYKHRTLRTIFDSFSTEWKETTIDEKIQILTKILKSELITLPKLIRSYKDYYLFDIEGKKHVVDSIDESLAIILNHLLKEK